MASTASRPLAMRTDEVGEVRDADRLHALILHRFERTGRRERFNHGRVEPAVDESPRLVVALIGGDRPGHVRRAALVELDLEHAHELARAGQSVGHRRGVHHRFSLPAATSPAAAIGAGSDTTAGAGRRRTSSRNPTTPPANAIEAVTVHPRWYAASTCAGE